MSFHVVNIILTIEDDQFIVHRYVITDNTYYAWFNTNSREMIVIMDISSKFFFPNQLIRFDKW